LEGDLLREKKIDLKRSIIRGLSSHILATAPFWTPDITQAPSVKKPIMFLISRLFLIPFWEKRKSEKFGSCARKMGINDEKFTGASIRQFIDCQCKETVCSQNNLSSCFLDVKKRI